jgi:hypothetical protein
MNGYIFGILTGILAMVALTSGAGPKGALFAAGFITCGVLAAALLRIKAVRRAIGPRHHRRHGDQPRRGATHRQSPAAARPATIKERLNHKHPPSPQPRATGDSQPAPVDQVAKDVATALVGLGARKAAAVESARRARQMRPAAGFQELLSLATKGEAKL